MKKIQTLLVDDEFLALNVLEQFFQHLDDFEVIAKVNSPVKAMAFLHEQPVDLLFLDIQMPVLSGNTLLKMLKNPPLTIFTTAYSEYALEAFELNVVDYLLKPFSFERFLQAAQKAKETLRLIKIASDISQGAGTGQEIKTFISIKADSKIHKIPIADIVCIEGLKEYVKIICQQTSYVTLESMKNLEIQLPFPQFIRVHKSYIVAKDKVQSIYGNMLELGKITIPISREKREEVIKEIFG